MGSTAGDELQMSGEIIEEEKRGFVCYCVKRCSRAFIKRQACVTYMRERSFAHIWNSVNRFSAIALRCLVVSSIAKMQKTLARLTVYTLEFHQVYLIKLMDVMHYKKVIL